MAITFAQPRQLNPFSAADDEKGKDWSRMTTPLCPFPTLSPFAFSNGRRHNRTNCNPLIVALTTRTFYRHNSNTFFFLSSTCRGDLVLHHFSILQFFCFSLLTMFGTHAGFPWFKRLIIGTHTGVLRANDESMVLEQGNVAAAH